MSLREGAFRRWRVKASVTCSALVLVAAPAIFFTICLKAGGDEAGTALRLQGLDDSTSAPTLPPTAAPTDETTSHPSVAPTVQPSTPTPSHEGDTWTPTASPTTSPPSNKPSATPTITPTALPTTQPSTPTPSNEGDTWSPTLPPSSATPSAVPSTATPTPKPTTPSPSNEGDTWPPTPVPSQLPSPSPTTPTPSASPTQVPTPAPSTPDPSRSPTTGHPTYFYEGNWSEAPTTLAPSWDWQAKSATPTPSSSWQKNMTTNIGTAKSWMNQSKAWAKDGKVDWTIGDDLYNATVQAKLQKEIAEAKANTSKTITAEKSKWETMWHSMFGAGAKVGEGYPKDNSAANTPEAMNVAAADETAIKARYNAPSSQTASSLSAWAMSKASAAQKAEKAVEENTLKHEQSRPGLIAANKGYDPQPYILSKSNALW